MARFLRLALPILVLMAMQPHMILAQQRGFRPVNVKVDGQPTALYSGSHALIIGISSYYNGWPPLPGVKTDVANVKAALEKQDFNVVIVSDLDKAGIDKAITDFIRKYGQDQNNRLVFYFAGHGHTIRTSYGEELGYIVPVDAPNPNKNKAEFQEKSIEMAQVDIYARRINSKHALFMFDACFSGSLFALSRAIPASISYNTSKPVRQFITSGSAEQTVPDKSIFCEQFVAALSGEGDLDKDGYITGAELGYFLSSQVVNYSRNSQNPQYGKIRNPNLDKGDFVFISPLGTQIQAVEAPVVLLGNIVLKAEMPGRFFLDHEYQRDVTSGTELSINDLPVGLHELKIVGDETWSETINVTENTTVSCKAVSPRLLDETAWEKASSLNTKSAYELYISKFPEGIYRTTARDMFAWTSALETESYKGYRDYLSAFPNGKYARIANEEACYHKAKESNFVDDYKTYFQTYPKGKYYQEIASYLESALFTIAENAFFLSNYENAKKYYADYIETFPSGEHISQARAKQEQTRLKLIEIENTKKREEIARLNALVVQYKKTASGNYAGGVAKLIFGLGIMGGGAYMTYDGWNKSIVQDSGETKDLLFAILGPSVTIVGIVMFSDSFRKFKTGSTNSKKAKEYKRQIRDITITCAPSLQPNYQSYGMALRLNF
ncbi:MAG: caspase family protein [Bacteroidetes bacterium]|nr:caspase family protein [Bacteroidota bacterium]